MHRIVILLLLTIGCATEPAHDPEPAKPDDADILLHRGIPSASEDWSFLPFSDQGAWFGLALPPEDRPELRGSVIGPFLMTSGRWLAPHLVRLSIQDVEEDRDVPLTGDGMALPGLLQQRNRADSLVVHQDLWFDSSTSAIVRVRVENEGDTAKRLQVTWSGEVFPDQATMTLSENGLAIETVDGASLFMQVDRPTPDGIVTEPDYVLPAGNPFTLEPGDSAEAAVVLSFAERGSFPDVTESFERNRERWRSYLLALETSAPERVLAVKSVQTLINNWRGPFGRMRYSALFPSSNVNYFNGFWAWDSWKHAVGLVRFAPGLAQDQIRAMFDHQNERGMIADVVYLDPDEDNWRDTKPPLAGWAIETVYDASGDVEFVRELYPKLVAYHAFWYADRDHDRDGLCEYGSTDGTLEAARWESGMDNAVRFDAAEMLENGPGAWSMNQESVDLNSYLYREKLALQKLAEVLGEADDVERFGREAESLRTQIREAMFDESTGWFYDIDVASGAIVPVQGPEGWIPLWAGVATEAQASAVRDTMVDPQKFRTHVPFPTVARDHPEFSDGYWRGLVWLDQAYFGIEGLRRYGFEEDADALEAQLFENLQGATAKGEPIYENYDAVSGEGRNVKHFSWSAAHLLLLALQR